MPAAAVGRGGGRVEELDLPVRGKMEQRLRIFEVVVHHVFAIVLHRIGAGSLMEDHVDLLMIETARPDAFQEVPFIEIIHDPEALDIFEFHHIGQVVDHQDIIPAPVVQALDDIAANEPGTASYDNHSLTSFTRFMIFRMMPVVE